MIGRFITPPSFPGVVRPRAAHRSKHVPTENPRPYVFHAPLRPLIIDTGRAAFLSVHLLPRVCGEEPLEQLRTTNAKRIIETLVRPSGVTIKRYSKRADADFRHASNLNVGDADGQTRAYPVPCSERIVGKQEVKQSARVRADCADYYISCAFGLRSVGFVREGTPGPKFIDFKLRGGRNEEILPVFVRFVCSLRYRLGARKIKRPVEVR